MEKALPPYSLLPLEPFAIALFVSMRISETELLRGDIYLSNKELLLLREQSVPISSIRGAAGARHQVAPAHKN